MKIFKKLLIVLLLLVGTLGLHSCSKDEDCESKTITIYSKIKPISFMIYPIENTEIPIYTNEIKYGDVFEVELNIGNYVIWPGRTGFQVMHGKSTIITIDENQNSSVEYR